MRSRTTRGLTVQVVRRVTTHPANAGARITAVGRSVLWQARKKTVRSPLPTSAYGHRVLLPRSSGSASNFVYFGPYFEWHEMHFFARVLRPGDRVLDIGANIGWYSFLASDLVGPEGHVDAFEPNPAIITHFRANLLRAGIRNVTLHPVAVGSAAGEVSFLVDLDVSCHVDPASAPGPLSHGARSKGDTRKRASRSAPVSCVRLDDIITTPPTIAKVDVEGYELEVLRGATGALARAAPRVWQLELLPVTLKRRNVTRNDILSLLHAHGFLIACYDEYSRALVRADEFVARAPNVLAIHGTHWEWVLDRLGDSVAPTFSRVRLLDFLRRGPPTPSPGR